MADVARPTSPSVFGFRAHLYINQQSVVFSSGTKGVWSSFMEARRLWNEPERQQQHDGVWQLFFGRTIGQSFSKKRKSRKHSQSNHWNKSITSRPDSPRQPWTASNVGPCPLCVFCWIARHLICIFRQELCSWDSGVRLTLVHVGRSGDASDCSFGSRSLFMHTGPIQRDRVVLVQPPLTVVKLIRVEGRWRAPLFYNSEIFNLHGGPPAGFDP